MLEIVEVVRLYLKEYYWLLNMEEKSSKKAQIQKSSVKFEIKHIKR